MYPYLLIKKKGKRMKEKAVGLWNRIAAKENKQIAKNVLLILLVSRLFYIFIGCVTNSAFGNNITFAKMKINAIGNIGVFSYNPNDTNKPYSYYMAKSIELLLECDAIYLCKGWKKSKGCRAEYEVAKIYGKKIIKQ